jgi:DnaJ-class molecular chaperone
MTDQSGDPYAVLGVARDARQDEISHAFRALLRRHHPDTRVDEATDRSDSALRDVVAAYGLLRDPIRRAAYDRRLREQASRRSVEAPTVPVDIRAHRAPEPPIVAGPVRWDPPGSGVR